RAAFGLCPARHLSVTSETADVWSGLPPGTAWRDAPPLRISPQLRKTGGYERRGQPNPGRDRSAGRGLLPGQAGRRGARTAAAPRRLRTAGPTLLSDLDVPDPRAFRLFLALLGDALAARRPGDTEVKTVTSDGALEVRLSLVPDGGTATIRTADGLLTGPEHV